MPDRQRRACPTLNDMLSGRRMTVRSLGSMKSLLDQSGGQRTVSGARQGLGDMAVQAALAIAQEFFGKTGQDGQTRVRFTQAHVLISGRLDTWEAWEDLDPRLKSLIGRLLRVRHNELASLQRFLDAARRACTAPDAPFRLPDGVTSYDAEDASPMHGQRPLVFAQRLIETMEAEHARQRTPVSAADGGLWEFGGRERTQITLPAGFMAPGVSPVVITSAPYLGEFPVTCKELMGIAAELDSARGGAPWRESVLATILAGLRDGDGPPIEELLLRAGRLNLLNAPTSSTAGPLTLKTTPTPGRRRHLPNQAERRAYSATCWAPTSDAADWRPRDALSGSTLPPLCCHENQKA